MALSYTTLVNVDAETAQKLAEFIGSKFSASESYVSDCKQLIDSAQTSALIAKLLEKQDILLDLESDNEVENVFQGIFSVMYLVGEGDQEGQNVKSIVKALSGNSSHATKRRLNMLVTLFNLCNEVTSKLEVLTAIFNYSMATSQVSLVAHMASRVEDWCSVWKLSAEQHRSLLLLLSKVLLADHQANQSLQVIIRFLQTYNGQPLDNVALGVLNTALVDAISSPLESFPDRAKLYEAISSTNVSGDSAKLLSLLKILCDGSLEEFSSFSKSNADIFASHKLNSNDLEHNMRILTLCSLAAQVSPKREISFADISTALKVDISEVELWVVEAIAAGLLDASIDQLQSMVTVTRYSYRAFGLEDWKALQKGLKDLSQQVHVAVASVQTKAM